MGVEVLPDVVAEVGGGEFSSTVLDWCIGGAAVCGCGIKPKDCGGTMPGSK